MQVHETAYLAGILDGEGSIMLQRSLAKRSSAYVFPVVKIANTDAGLMDWIVRKTGMGARQYRTRMHLGCKDVIHWTVASNDAIWLLTTVRPYLRIKVQQADVVLALDAENTAALRKSGKQAFGHGNPVPAWLREFRAACYWYVRDLNRRGPGPLRYGDEVRHHLAQMRHADAA